MQSSLFELLMFPAKDLSAGKKTKGLDGSSTVSKTMVIIKPPPCPLSTLSCTLSFIPPVTQLGSPKQNVKFIRNHYINRTSTTSSNTRTVTK